MSRVAWLAVALALLGAAPSFAQFAPAPTLDGTVSDGEYAHISGDWAMTWDATYLYVGIKNLGSSSDDLILYFDLDPLSPTPAGGTNNNGNLSGYADGSITVSLPFRADARIRAGQSAMDVRNRDLAGGWGSANSNGSDMTVASNSTHREFKVLWTALGGLSAAPESANWLGFSLGSEVAQTMPAANPTGASATTHPYFYSLSDVDSSSIGSPFQIRSSTWRVTSTADSGANTLRQAIADANADSTSIRRYITFGLTGGTTIQLDSALPAITKTTTVDGLTQTGGTTPAVTVRGPNTSVGQTGVYFSNAPASVVRGLVVQNHYYGINVESSAGTSIEDNYAGTNAAGSAAAPNAVGIRVSSSAGTIVDGNVMSGNSSEGLYIDSSTVEVYNNVIGRSADKFSPLGNIRGITMNGEANVIGDPENPNVIASNNRAIDADNDGGLVIRGNSIYLNDSNSVVITNIVMPSPAILTAIASGDGLAITFDLTASSNTTTAGSVMLDVYEADPDINIPQGRTWRASQCFAGNTFDDQVWNISGDWAAGEKIVLTATAYAAGDCTLAADGTSQFTPFFTTTGIKTFTGSGNFTDTSRWSSGELPASGESFVIKGGAVVDSAIATVFGTAYLGSAGVTGSLIFDEEGSLHVTSLESRVNIGLIELTLGGNLRVDGTLDSSNLMIAGTEGAIEYGGTGQTLAPLTYGNVIISGSVTGATGTATITEGEFTVAAGGSFTPGGGTVELRNGAVVNDGTLTFNTLSVPSGFEGEAVSSFQVAASMVVDGTFDAEPAAVIGGTGTLSGTGLIEVTGTASPNSFAGQYALNRASNLSVAYAGESAQSADPRTYTDLIIENPAGVVAAGDLTVTGTVTLEEGALSTSTSASLIVANTSPAAVVVDEGWVNGPLRRTVTSGTYSYPVGTASIAAPVSVTFNGVTNVGDVIVTATNGEHPQIAGSALDANRTVNLYWSYQVIDAAYSTYDITMNFDASSRDASANPSTFALRGYNNSTTSWFNVATAVPATTSITASGLPGAVGPVINFVAGNQLLASYTVSATSPQSAGTPFTTTVTAKDAMNVTVNDSTTDVTMTSNGNAQFDRNGDGIFGDHTKTLTSGSFTISTKDNTPQTVTITATDANGKTGSTSVTVNIGPPSHTTSQITISPEQVTANGTSQATITVQAKDLGGNSVITGGATVTLSATHGTIGSVTDHNNGTYTATYTAGTQAVGNATISGTINSQTITDTATVTLVAGPATTLLVAAPATATGGSAFNVTVTARDAHGNTATSYTGTIRFTSTAQSATLPSNYTFISGDAGVKTFSVTLSSAGSITLTATDTATASITGNDVVSVTGSTSTTVSSSSPTSAAGQSVTFTATVTSQTSGTISGTVTFKDGSTTLGTGTLNGSGQATFNTSSLSVGSHSITAEYGGSSTFTASTSPAITQTVNASAFGAPVNFSATATSTTQIVLSWSAVSGATSYRIYRNSGSGYTLLTSTSNTTFPDTVTANKAYAYKVAAFNGTTESAMSSPDAATTVVFTDSSLTGVKAKAAHITELRTAVEAMRTAAGLSSSYSFTDPSLASGAPIKRLHIVELRSALDQARGLLGLPALAYTDSAITPGSTTVKAAHITELRAGTQ